VSPETIGLMHACDGAMKSSNPVSWSAPEKFCEVAIVSEYRVHTVWVLWLTGRFLSAARRPLRLRGQFF
jgi:hypothetical protein